jgi:hypothetical protein
MKHYEREMALLQVRLAGKEQGIVWKEQDVDVSIIGK